MKKFLLCLCLTLIAFSGMGQLSDYHSVNSIRFLQGMNDTTPYPFTGGFVSPQFSEIDLNGDGIKDLFILDRSGNKITCYLNKGKAGFDTYIHAPGYEPAFPPLVGWALLRDYNCDGLEDIFTGTSESGLTVYTNTSKGGKLSFELFATDFRDKSLVNISIALMDIPAIDDVDGDGDLDILSFPATGGIIYMFRNQQKEENLPCDSLKFKFVDFCWGTFAEGSSSNSLFLGVDCSYPKDYSTLAVHSGSTLLTLNLDNDQDKDLLMGDVEYPDLLALINGKSEYSWPWDTIISYTGNFPAYDVPGWIENFPSAFYLDLNNDGKKDLIISSNDDHGAKNKDQIWVYENIRTTNYPDFRFRDSSFLQNATLDFGSLTSPSFFDADGDGDEDLVLAYAGNYSETKNLQDRLALFRRSGDSLAIFEMVDEDYLNLSVDGLQRLHPCFYDMNGDGLKDLLLGQLNGRVRFYENSGTLTNPAFTLISDHFSKIDVGSLATPTVYDLNQDSLPDLVIGTGLGPIQYFQNLGSTASPLFDSLPQVDTLWKVWVNSSTTNYEYDAQDPTIITDTIKSFSYSGRSAPQFLDLTNDSIPELICGSETGRVSIYSINRQNLRDSVMELAPCLATTYDTILRSIDIGSLSKPALYDANSDGMPDFFVGTSRGGIHYFQSSFSPSDSINIGLQPIEKRIHLHVWPNPNKGHFQVSLDPGYSGGKLVLYDVFGHLVSSWTISPEDEGQKTLNMPNMANGVYFLYYVSPNERSPAVKIRMLR